LKWQRFNLDLSAKRSSRHWKQLKLKWLNNSKRFLMKRRRRRKLKKVSQFRSSTQINASLDYLMRSSLKSINGDYPSQTARTKAMFWMAGPKITNKPTNSSLRMVL
jgi:hypothetical protein